MKVQWLKVALDEYEATIRYLIAESGVTAAKQLDEQIKHCIRLLVEFPQLGTPVQNRARRIALRGCPYFLIYRIHTHHLCIVALAHQRRRPGFWADRR